MRLQSQTWSNLRQLLGELPKRRVRLFILVLLASLVQGLLDVFLVALLARLVGLLAGSRLEDYCRGSRFLAAVSSISRDGWWHC